MSKKKLGLKKILPAIVAVFMLTFVMLCSVLPAGAFELSAEMLQDLKDFFENRDELALDRDALAAKVQYYVEKEFEW